MTSKKNKIKDKKKNSSKVKERLT